MSPEEAIAAQRLALQVEYGQFVCKSEAPIYIDGARAFNPGDAVPAYHVKTYGLDDQVDKVKNPPKQTKAALAELVDDQKKDGA